ncbi:MAG: helix-turn-helix domain-containing protein [Nitrososphaerales archaeon]
MNIIPSGREFMKEVSMHQLKDLYRKEKNANAKLRLLAAMMRKDGKGFPEIAEHMQMAQSTLSDWLKRLHINGLERLYDKKKPGAKPLLAYGQMRELRNDLPCEIDRCLQLACH